MSIETVKKMLLENNGSNFTCFLFKEYSPKHLKKYQIFIESELKGTGSLRHQGKQLLDNDDALMKRYLFIDFFKQELDSLK